MRNVEFPPSVVARVVARRGTEHIFSDLNPKRTALIVIDLQYAFMDDAIGHAVCPAMHFGQHWMFGLKTKSC